MGCFKVNVDNQTKSKYLLFFLTCSIKHFRPRFSKVVRLSLHAAFWPMSECDILAQRTSLLQYCNKMNVVDLGVSFYTFRCNFWWNFRDTYYKGHLPFLSPMTRSLTMRQWESDWEREYEKVIGRESERERESVKEFFFWNFFCSIYWVSFLIK